LDFSTNLLRLDRQIVAWKA